MVKRVIRGTLYDTQTATLIAEWESELEGERDSLYRTKSGKYFASIVNPRLPGKYIDDIRRLCPLSRREAIHLACEMLGVERARGYFTEEDGGEKTLSVRIPVRVYEILRDVAAERGVSMGQLIEELVNEGEPFGDDAQTFDEIAAYEREKEEALRIIRGRCGKDGGK